MSDDFPMSTVGVDTTVSVLDEIHAAEAEFSEFFGGVFDQLHALSLELYARHKGLEAIAEKQSPAGRQQVEIADQLESLRRLVENLADPCSQRQANH